MSNKLLDGASLCPAGAEKATDVNRGEDAARRLRLCPAGADELREIAAFLDACWREAYREILDAAYLAALSAEERYRGLSERFRCGGSRFLTLREAGGMLVGAAVFGKSITEDFPDDGEISAIYLRADHIGRGFGHALFTAAESELKAQGYAHSVLDVFTANTRALRFYQNHGYQAVCERTIAFGGKDYPYTILRKPLTVRERS